MNEVNAFWLCLGLLVGLTCGVFLPEFLSLFHRERICTTKTDAEDRAEVQEINEDEPKRANFEGDFAVTGKPRVPWHIRRKELEAAARTKRKRLESFQEYV